VKSMRLDNSTLGMALGQEEAEEQVVGEVALETLALGRDYQENILVRWGNSGQGKKVQELEFGLERKIGEVQKGHIARRICQVA